MYWERLRYFVFSSTLFLSYLALISKAGAAEVQITIEGTAATKIYGLSDCKNDEKVSFSWRFTPGGQIVPTQPATYKIILGSNDPKSGIVLLEGKLDVSNVSTNPTGTLEIKGTFSGVPDSKTEDRTKGMVEDGLLTIRDIIGYYRVVTEQNPPPPQGEICKLENPGIGGEKGVELYVVAEYHIADLTGTGATRKQDAEGMLKVQFDMVPPPAPTKPNLYPGETSIDVRWETEKDYTYDVVLSTKPFDPNKEQIRPVNNSPLSGGSFTISNLSPRTKYYVAIRAYDKAGNPGPFSQSVSTSTIELLDFYEAYRSAGGQDRGFSGGGYCFIATAAYGDYGHPVVRILRRFRDDILLKSTPGRNFVAWYYRISPPYAKWLVEHPFARQLVKFSLYPVSAMAWLILHPIWLSLLLLSVVSLFFAYRFGFFRGIRSLLGVLLAVSLLSTFTSSVSAKTPRNFGLELRFGPYSPQVDSESKLQGGTKKPFAEFFSSPFPALELGFEWLFFKKFGSLGLAGTFGLSWGIAPAKTPGTTGSASGTAGGNVSGNSGSNGNPAGDIPTNNTGFWIVPLRLELLYRFDYFAHRNGFPLVPYLRGGVDYYLWWVTDSTGAISKFTAQSGQDDRAIGGRLGFNVGFGLQFLLDILDPVAARSFDVEMGVNHTYLFFEWNFYWIGILSPGLNLSDSSFRAGLMFQF